jgi:zinc protease
MILFEKFTLKNGLKVLVHEDHSTPLAAMNILYDVGARDEDPQRTGFAHLFEHLMFGGSINIPNYDEPLQRAGGENNAFTTNDITNYYLTLPAANLETAFWLESDRMLSLAFSEKSLDVQRNVVIEEFKQRYLNQPYGDVWLNLRPLAYKVHPYQWATIGKEILHIEEAKLSDVKNFFQKFYHPGNAILVISGNIKTEEVKALAEKWFEPIPSGVEYIRNLPQEPRQTEKRTLSVQAEVPLDAIYMCFHCPGRKEETYYAADLLTDILSRGKSSRLYVRLIKEQRLFSELNAYITGDIDSGLIVIEGKLIQGKTIEEAEAGIRKELEEMKTNLVSDLELSKVKNKIESSLQFSEMNIMNKAMNLAYSELLGNANLVNEELEKYENVSDEEIRQAAEKIFRIENCSCLYYISNVN